MSRLQGDDSRWRLEELWSEIAQLRSCPVVPEAMLSRKATVPRAPKRQGIHSSARARTTSADVSGSGAARRKGGAGEKRRADGTPAGNARTVRSRENSLEWGKKSRPENRQPQTRVATRHTSARYSDSDSNSDSHRSMSSKISGGNPRASRVRLSRDTDSSSRSARQGRRSSPLVQHGSSTDDSLDERLSSLVTSVLSLATGKDEAEVAEDLVDGRAGEHPDHRAKARPSLLQLPATSGRGLEVSSMTDVKKGSGGDWDELRHVASESQLSRPSTKHSAERTMTRHAGNKSLAWPGCDRSEQQQHSSLASAEERHSRRSSASEDRSQSEASVHGDDDERPKSRSSYTSSSASSSPMSSQSYSTDSADGSHDDREDEAERPGRATSGSTAKPRRRVAYQHLDKDDEGRTHTVRVHTKSRADLVDEWNNGVRDGTQPDFSWSNAAKDPRFSQWAKEKDRERKRQRQVAKAHRHLREKNRLLLEEREKETEGRAREAYLDWLQKKKRQTQQAMTSQYPIRTEPDGADSKNSKPSFKEWRIGKKQQQAKVELAASLRRAEEKVRKEKQKAADGRQSHFEWMQRKKKQEAEVPKQRTPKPPVQVDVTNDFSHQLKAYALRRKNSLARRPTRLDAGWKTDRNPNAPESMPTPLPPAQFRDRAEKPEMTTSFWRSMPFSKVPGNPSKLGAQLTNHVSGHGDTIPRTPNRSWQSDTTTTDSTEFPPARWKENAKLSDLLPHMERPKPQGREASADSCRY